MLAEYLKTLQGFVRDRAQKNLEPDDLISYINRARREIALRTQCIRVLTPIAGQIESIAVLNPGQNYTAPVVTISPPDAPGGMLENPGGAQALAVAQLLNGQISNVSMVNGGDGYFQPSVTVTDPTGSGAVLSARVMPFSQTQGSQEVYRFSDIPLRQFPGVDSVFWVQSVSIIFSNYRYSLAVYPFSAYQAFIRQYPRQYLFVPTVAGSFGSGSEGALYLYPIASSPYQLELDCYCLPTDLEDYDQFEAIAKPWTDAVPLGAAVYAFEELQNLNSARYWAEKFDSYVHKYSAWARPGRAINPYGRY